MPTLSTDELQEQVNCLYRDAVLYMRNDSIITGRIQAFDSDGSIVLSNAFLGNKAATDKKSLDTVIVLADNIKRWEARGDPDKDSLAALDSAKINQRLRSKSGVGFCTDAQYADSKQEAVPDRPLKQWEAHADVPNDDKHELVKSESDCWPATEMFKRNQELHQVKSDYTDKLDGYSTAKPLGDEEARKNADKLAASIEKDPTSQLNIQAENHDEELDIGPEEGMQTPTVLFTRGGKRPSSRQSSNQHRIASNSHADNFRSSSSKKQWSRNGDKRASPSKPSESRNREHRPRETAQNGDQRDQNTKTTFNPNVPEFVPRSSNMPNGSSKSSSKQQGVSANATAHSIPQVQPYSSHPIPPVDPAQTNAFYIPQQQQYPVNVPQPAISNHFAYPPQRANGVQQQPPPPQMPYQITPSYFPMPPTPCMVPTNWQPQPIGYTQDAYQAHWAFVQQQQAILNQMYHQQMAAAAAQGMIHQPPQQTRQGPPAPPAAANQAPQQH